MRRTPSERCSMRNQCARARTFRASPQPETVSSDWPRACTVIARGECGARAHGQAEPTGPSRDPVARRSDRGRCREPSGSAGRDGARSIDGGHRRRGRHLGVAVAGRADRPRLPPHRHDLRRVQSRGARRGSREPEALGRPSRGARRTILRHARPCLAQRARATCMANGSGVARVREPLLRATDPRRRHVSLEAAPGLRRLRGSR